MLGYFNIKKLKLLSKSYSFVTLLQCSPLANHYKSNIKMMATTVIHISHPCHVAVSKHFPKNEFNTTLVRGKFNFNSLKMRQKFAPGQTRTGKEFVCLGSPSFPYNYESTLFY